VVHACEFETAKANPEKVVDESIRMLFKGSGQTFIHKGTNGRWKDVLTEKVLEQYPHAMKKTLSDDCARWLESGRNAL